LRITSMNKALATTFLALLTALMAYPQQALADSGPISLHPLKPGETAGGATLHHTSLMGTLFLITNHTAKPLVISLSAVQVKKGSNWITQSHPHGPLKLSATNSIRMPGETNAFIPSLTTTKLAPHHAAYSTIQFTEGPVSGGPAPGSPVGLGMNYIGGDQQVQSGGSLCPCRRY